MKEDVMRAFAESQRRKWENKDEEEELGSGDVDRSRARRAVHREVGKGVGTGVGASAAMGLTAATGGAAAPLAPVITQLGAMGGEVIGNNFKEMFEDPWKKNNMHKKLGKPVKKVTNAVKKFGRKLGLG